MSSELARLKNQARIRVMAKKFKYSIPTNMAIPIPDSIVDSLNDEDLKYFIERLKLLGLRQKDEYPGYGHWERI